MAFYEYDETHLILKHYRYISGNDEQNASRREKLNALISVAKYRPKLTLGIFVEEDIVACHGWPSERGPVSVLGLGEL